MSDRRDTRRLAMQLLYQIDVRGEFDADVLAECVDPRIDDDAVAAPAIELAQAAWASHDAADALATELAEDWPTRRQPPVDRAILRLAYHEMVTGRVPVKIAINEAVELAKHYSTEQSPSFVNAVLDKLAKRLAESGPTPTSPEGAAPTTEGEWLNDAIQPTSPDT